MKATVEISLHPLSDDYKAHVIEFLFYLNQDKNIEIVTSGMSTLIYGDYGYIWDLLRNRLKHVFDRIEAIAVIKIGRGELKYDPENDN